MLINLARSNLITHINVALSLWTLNLSSVNRAYLWTWINKPYETKSLHVMNWETQQLMADEPDAIS